MTLHNPARQQFRSIKLGANLYYMSNGTNLNVAQTANQLVVSPYDVATPCSLTAMIMEVMTLGSSGAAFRFALYADDGSGVWPGNLIVDAGTVANTATGVQTSTSSMPLSLLAGRYWVGGTSQGGPTTAAQIRCLTQTGTESLPCTAATPSVLNTGAAQSGVTGSLPSIFSTTVTYVTGGAPRVWLRLT